MDEPSNMRKVVKPDAHAAEEGFPSMIFRLKMRAIAKQRTIRIILISSTLDSRRFMVINHQPTNEVPLSWMR